MKGNDAKRAEAIRELNDRLRTTGKDGRVFMTRGLMEMGMPFTLKTVEAMRAFDDFNADNDPHGEHDFGAITIDEQKIFWKIDYYDAAMERGSDDPSDPAKTTRVLTLMLASEY